MSATRQVSPEEAEALLADGYVYLDVRTEAEFEAGHVPGAFNVPVALASQGSMTANPDFERVVEGAFSKDTRCIVGCKAGGRSATAMKRLGAAGFTSLVELHAGWDGARDAFGRVVEEGWSRKGLPCETGLPEGHSYSALKSRAGGA